MILIDRREAVRTIVRTLNGRQIYSGGRGDPRREVSSVTGIILHHTNIGSMRVERFDPIIANYVVMKNGNVLYVRDIASALNSVGTDQHCIDIEIDGRYHERDCEPPPMMQIHACRDLVAHLMATQGVRRIYAHRHFTGKPCPGHHLWYNVGLWCSAAFSLEIHNPRLPLPVHWGSNENLLPRRPAPPPSDTATIAR